MQPAIAVQAWCGFTRAPEIPRPAVPGIVSVENNVIHCGEMRRPSRPIAGNAWQGSESRLDWGGGLVVALSGDCYTTLGVQTGELGMHAKRSL